MSRTAVRTVLVATVAALVVGATTGAAAAQAAVPPAAQSAVPPAVPSPAQSAVPSAAPPTAPSAAQAREGDLLEVRLRDLRPTQPNIGHDQIHYKLGRYAGTKDTDRGRPNKRFDDWCETDGRGEAAEAGPGATLRDPSSFRCTIATGAETPASVAAMKTVVVGPGNALYLTDGHHTTTSLLETTDGGPDVRVRMRVQANLSRLTPAAFWAQMQARSWVWLRTADGTTITPQQLPDRIGLALLPDDPYRGLVYLTRDIGYSPPADAPEYLEFFWASWLRTRIDLGRYDLHDPASYLRAVTDASQLMSSTPGDTEIAPGRTADQLGRMARWNDGKAADKGEFGDLSRPITDPRPGKVAYAVDSRNRVSATPACTRTVTGASTGPLTVGSGVLCLNRARVRGPVTVTGGASLVLRGSDVTGPVTATRARVVEVCGARVTGPVVVRGSTERARVGGWACTPNEVRGPVVVG